MQIIHCWWRQILYTNTTSGNNTAVGLRVVKSFKHNWIRRGSGWIWNSLDANTTGDQNTACGNNSLGGKHNWTIQLCIRYCNISGNLINNTTASNNTAMEGKRLLY